MRYAIKNMAVKTKVLLVVLASMMLITVAAIPVTMAFMTDKTDEVVNQFTQAEIGIEVVEDFDGSVKSDVTVKNIGEMDVYARIMLLPEKTEADGSVSADGIDLSDFDFDGYMGEGWVEGTDGFCYYTKAIGPNEEAPYLFTKATFAGEMELGQEVSLNVIAQSVAAASATGAWDVSVDADGVLSLN